MPRRRSILPRSFYDRDTVLVARELIGKLLVRKSDDGLTAGRIVEVEAYLDQDDAACHAASGRRTKRNASMFGPPGIAYVYMIHSRWCFNVVTQPEGVPSAVLVRAIEPVAGEPLMRQRRGLDNPLEVARGPAKTCQALAIDRSLDGHDLTAGKQLWIESDERADALAIATSGRIGISCGQELPLRFFVPDNRYVSKPGWAKRWAAG